MPLPARALLTASLALAGCVPVVPSVDPGPGAPCVASPEAEVVRLVNRERAARRLAPLEVDVRLARAAEAHARDQARRGVSGHTGSDGSEPADRAEAQGYDWRMIAENVAAGQPAPGAAVAAWMASPGHRANILDPQARHLGAGHVAGGGGRGPFWVTVFGDTRGPAVAPPGGCHP